MEFARHQATNEPISLTDEERKRHLYLIGRTGSGKSTVLEHLLFEDLLNEIPFVFIDLHGRSAPTFLDGVPKQHQNRVLYLNPSDPLAPAFNPFQTPGIPSLVA